MFDLAIMAEELFEARDNSLHFRQSKQRKIVTHKNHEQKNIP